MTLADGTETDARPRARRDRRDHELHEHVEPVGDDRRRAARPEGGRSKGLTVKPWVKTSSPRLEGRDRVPRPRRPDRVPRGARLQPRRLRLHDLHRQHRPAAGRDLRRSINDERPRGRRRCCPATATSRAGSTPTCGRTTSRRRRWSSPTRSPARWTSTSYDEPLGEDERRQAGLPEGHLADADGGRARRSRRRSSPTCSARATARSSTATSAGTRSRCPTGDRFAWDDDSTYVRNPPFFEDLPRRARAGRRHRGRARARGARRQRHDRPHLAGRLDQARRPRRQVPDRARRRAARTSTPTAHAAATTR